MINYDSEDDDPWLLWHVKGISGKTFTRKLVGDMKIVKEYEGPVIIAQLNFIKILLDILKGINKGTYHFVILLYKYDENDEDMNVDVENRELGKNPEAGNIFMVTAGDDEEVVSWFNFKFLELVFTDHSVIVLVEWQTWMDFLVGRHCLKF